MPISWKVMSLVDIENYQSSFPISQEDETNRLNELEYRSDLLAWMTSAEDYRVNGGSNPPSPPPPPPGI